MILYIPQINTFLCMSHDPKTPEEGSICFSHFPCYYYQIPDKTQFKIGRHYFGLQFQDGTVHYGCQRKRQLAGQNASVTQEAESSNKLGRAPKPQWPHTVPHFFQQASSLKDTTTIQIAATASKQTQEPMENISQGSHINKASRRFRQLLHVLAFMTIAEWWKLFERRVPRHPWKQLANKKVISR